LSKICPFLAKAFAMLGLGWAKELRGVSGLPTAKLCELGLGRRRLFGELGVETELLAVTRGVLSLRTWKGCRALGDR